MENALKQVGPWQGKNINFKKQWLVSALKEKILEINWQQVSIEVKRFLDAEHASALELWGRDFFMDKTRSLASLMS